VSQLQVCNIINTKLTCFHSVGKAPYDRVTIFGKAQFTDNVISCFSIDNSSTTCTQAMGSTVLAPIDRSIAKR
jgi:hypothetical protein